MSDSLSMSLFLCQSELFCFVYVTVCDLVCVYVPESVSASSASFPVDVLKIYMGLSVA